MNGAAIFNLIDLFQYHISELLRCLGPAASVVMRLGDQV